MWDRAKSQLGNWCTSPLGKIMLFTIVVSIPWLVGWVRNAEYGAKYNLADLQNMYIWVATQLNAQHLINSKWNSQQDKPPKASV